MIEMLQRYLTENYSQDAMLFLPHFQPQKLAKVVEPPKPLPQLKIEKVEKVEKPAPLPPPSKPKIHLEKPQPALPTAQPKMASLVRQAAPGLFLHKEPLNDEKAKQIKTQFLLPKVPVFYTKNLEVHRTFLENIAKAVDSLTGSCRLIEAETISLFDSFSLIIAPDVTIFSSAHLITHFKEIPATGEKWLGNVPLFLLPDLALYKKDHHLKRSLWLELRKACTPLLLSTNR